MQLKRIHAGEYSAHSAIFERHQFVAVNCPRYKTKKRCFMAFQLCHDERFMVNFPSGLIIYTVQFSKLHTHLSTSLLKWCWRKWLICRWNTGVAESFISLQLWLSLLGNIYSLNFDCRWIFISTGWSVRKEIIVLVLCTLPSACNCTCVLRKQTLYK